MTKSLGIKLIYSSEQTWPDHEQSFLMALNRQNQANHQVYEDQKEGPELALFKQRSRFVVADRLWTEGAKWLDWHLCSGFVCQSLAHKLKRFFEQNVVI